MLAGLISPTEGRAVVAGEPVRVGELSMGLRRKVGFLAEEPAFYQWMTGTEFLVFVGRLYGRTEQQAQHPRRGTALGGGPERPRRRPHQRLLPGHAPASGHRPGTRGEDPQVLLLDEPASALDPIGRKEILDLIASLKDRATIIMSSHILDDVQRICTWVGIMRRGELLTEAPLEDLLRSYARPVFRVEVAERTAELADALRREPWLRELSAEGGGLRVLAAEPTEAQRRIPVLVADLGERLVEFAMVSPTLEDAFIQLVRDEPPPAADAEAGAEGPAGRGRGGRWVMRVLLRKDSKELLRTKRVLFPPLLFIVLGIAGPLFARPPAGDPGERPARAPDDDPGDRPGGRDSPVPLPGGPAGAAGRHPALHGAGGLRETRRHPGGAVREAGLPTRLPVVSLAGERPPHDRVVPRGKRGLPPGHPGPAGSSTVGGRGDGVRSLGRLRAAGVLVDVLLLRAGARTGSGRRPLAALLPAAGAGLALGAPGTVGTLRSGGWNRGIGAGRDAGRPPLPGSASSSRAWTWPCVCVACSRRTRAAPGGAVADRGILPLSAGAPKS